MTDSKFKPPVEDKGDLVHAAARSFIGGIPIGGTFGIELFNQIFTSSIERRRKDWMRDVGEAISRLVEQSQPNLRFEELQSDEGFIDTVMQASLTAIRTSQQEKLNSLRNAILNSAGPESPEEAIRQIYVKLIDEFSGLHIQLLRFLDDPKAWYEKRNKASPSDPPKTIWALIEHAMPELGQKQRICEHVCFELNKRQLLIADSISDPVSNYPFFPNKPRVEQVGYLYGDKVPGIQITQYVGQPTSIREWTTEFGQQFLAFIQSPLRPAENKPSD